MTGPLDAAPVSVYPPFTSYPAGQYRHEPAGERRMVLYQALAGVELGDYDRRILDWLAGWDTPTVGAVVSLLLRVRGAGEQHATRRRTTARARRRADGAAGAHVLEAALHAAGEAFLATSEDESASYPNDAIHAAVDAALRVAVPAELRAMADAGSCSADQTALRERADLLAAAPGEDNK